MLSLLIQKIYKEKKMKRIMSTLLAGAAIIALSGCSDSLEDTEIEEVELTELQEGYEVFFDAYAMPNGVEVKPSLTQCTEMQADIVDSEEAISYKFCGPDQIPANVAPSEPGAGDGAYGKYNASGIEMEHGQFAFRQEENRTRFSHDGTYYDIVVPNRILEKGEKYLITQNCEERTVEKIIKINCEDD